MYRSQASVLCKELGRGAGRLLDRQGGEMGTVCQAHAPLGLLCLQGGGRSIQVRLAGWDGLLKVFGLFAQVSSLFPDRTELEREGCVLQLSGLKLHRTVPSMWHLEEREAVLWSKFCVLD